MWANDGARRRVGDAQETPDPVDADDAAGGDAGVDLGVGDVAPVGAERPRVRVAEEDRRRRRLHDLEAGALAGVRAVHQHAGGVDRGDGAPAELRERRGLVVAAAAERVVAVVGEVDLPHAEVEEETHRLRPAEQRQAALQVERDREPARPPRRLDLGDAAGEREAVLVPAQLRAKAGQDGHDLPDRVHVHADIDRDEVDPLRPVPFEDGEIGIGVQRQAGMCVPDEVLPQDCRRLGHRSMILRLPAARRGGRKGLLINLRQKGNGR